MTLRIAIVTFWGLILLAFFGLARLSIARRGLDDDWQALVAFGRRFPPLFDDAPAPPALLESAPPGIVPPGDPDAPSAPASIGALYGHLRAHQTRLQSEMKWFAQKGTSPFQWFQAGVRGIVLLPTGLAFDGDALRRARRRDMESNPDFERVVSALLGVIVFVLLVVLVLVVRDGLPALARHFKEA